MKVCLVILEDRHTDVRVEVFNAECAARARAEKIIGSYDSPADKDDQSILPPSWLLSQSLGCDGADHIRIEVAEVHEEKS